MLNPWEIQLEQSTRLTIPIHASGLYKLCSSFATMDTRSLIGVTIHHPRPPCLGMVQALSNPQFKLSSSGQILDYFVHGMLFSVQVT